MSDLLIKQSVTRRSIERMLSNFKKLGRENITAAKVRSRIAFLQEAWSKFQEVHVQLLRSTPETDLQSVDYFRNQEFEATEEAYQSTRDALTDFLEELEPVVSPASAFYSTGILAEPQGLAMPNMPKFRLPLFDGNYADWATFRDKFISLVIRNSSLSDFARMHYLVSSLKGTALNCVSTLPVTADNFRLAWSALKERFDDKQRLISTHFATLFGISALQRESAEDLQLLRDRVQNTISLMDQLGRSQAKLWSDFLVYFIKQKLDPVTRKAWNLKNSDAEIPRPYTELLAFLSSRSRALENNDDVLAPKSTRSNATSRVHHASTASSASVSSSVSACPLCKRSYYLTSCSRFSALTPVARLETAKKFHRCLNCLSSSHTLAACKSQYSCRACQQRHHSMLHMDSHVSSVASTNIDKDTEPRAASVSVNSAVTNTVPRTNKQILLATARVKISVRSGRSVSVRALLDQGSEATFILESIAQLLRAKKQRSPINISAVGGVQIGQVRHAINISVSPLHSEAPLISTTALVLNSLTQYAPRHVISLRSMSHISDLSWADPDPTSSDPIHLILGANLYGELILDGVKRGAVGQPLAQRTIFGWILSGPLSMPPADSVPLGNLTVHHCTQFSALEEAIGKFWEVENIPSTRVLTPQEKQCEDHFCLTHSRAPDGRYIVRLPFNVELPLNLGHTRRRAEIQFLRLQRRFNLQPSLRSEYNQFMADYEDLRHMRKAPESQGAIHHVFIPHHPVVKADSATTRLRVVFNASSRSESGLSLNDLLHAGPKLQTELPAILLQWRQFRFVYTADIAKMFRQILVDKRDLDHQCILWQGENSASIDDYHLLTVTYISALYAFVRRPLPPLSSWVACMRHA
ncbi:uncharacterized protein [Cardiocondyla obscurior]|uniref:uncharacterized protein n=1 Tax=Cardiocondyla obscurior TaxID=286306 RepID=UPI00396581A3